VNEGKKLVYAAIQKLEKARVLLGDPIDITLAIGCLHNLLRLLSGTAAASGDGDDDKASVTKGQRVKRKPRVKDDFDGCHAHD